MGGGLLILGCALSIAACLVIRWYAMKKNKALKKEEERTGIINHFRFQT